MTATRSFLPGVLVAVVAKASYAETLGHEVVYDDPDLVAQLERLGEFHEAATVSWTTWHTSPAERSRRRRPPEPVTGNTGFLTHDRLSPELTQRAELGLLVCRLAPLSAHEDTAHSSSAQPSRERPRS